MEIFSEMFGEIVREMEVSYSSCDEDSSSSSNKIILKFEWKEDRIWKITKKNNQNSNEMIYLNNKI